jgi:hypothetical protein
MTIAAIPTSVAIGPHRFDRALYDPDRDILDLSLEARRGGVGGEDTPEGHMWFSRDDEICGVQFVEPRRQLERDGGIFVTLPDGNRVRAEAAEALIAAPQT